MSTFTVTRHRRHATAALAGGLTLFLRRLRLEPASALTMFVLVAGTCFLFAALPRLFNAFADDGLRFAVTHATPDHSPSISVRGAIVLMRHVPPVARHPSRAGAALAMRPIFRYHSAVRRNPSARPTSGA